jgi:DNA-binding Lrp family transcriptional regulator
MSSPSNSIKETMSPERTVPFGGANSSKAIHGQIPGDILARVDVSPAAKVVLAVMRMKSYNSGGLIASMAILAKAAGLSRTHVFESLKELESAGLIRKVGQRIKQVQPYEISCDVDVAVLPLSREPSTLRKRRRLTPCGMCKTPCVPYKTTGWCAACSKEARNRVITKTLVREEVAVALSKTGTASRRVEKSGFSTTTESASHERPKSQGIHFCYR